MKKFLLLFSLLLFAFHFSFSQAPLVMLWDARFGGDTTDALTSLIQTRDGGYLLGGYSLSGKSGDKTENKRGSFYNDYWVVKIDSFGNKQWDRRFGGTADDYLASALQTNDKGYILAGYSNSDAGGDKTDAAWPGGFWGYDFWVIKIDSSGNKQWDKTLGGTDDDILYTVKQSNDGAYILGGQSLSPVSGNKTQALKGSWDYWMVKIDQQGNKLWDKDFGGNNLDYFYCLQQTHDKGYLLGGYSFSPISGDKTQASIGGGDFWMVKTDSLGIRQWDKQLGSPGTDKLIDLKQTADKGYILAGLSQSAAGGDKTQSSWGGYDYWLVKTDSLCNKQWDKNFGGKFNEHDFGNVVVTSDNGFLVCGSSYSADNGEKTEKNLGALQSWMVKTDKSGNKLWDKTILTPGSDFGGHAIQTAGGVYAVANYSDGGIGGYKTQPKRGAHDFWIIKFKDTTVCSILPGIITALHDTVCPGAAPVLSVTGSSGTPQWQYSATGNKFTDLVGLTGSLCLDIPLQTSYYRAYSGGNCADTSTAYKIFVLDAPKAAYSFSVSGSTVTFNSGTSSGSIANYSWDFGDGTFSTLPNPVHTYSRADTFYACLTIYNGINCPSLICHDVIIAGIPTVTNNLSSKNELAIYPNPANNSLVINRNSYERQGTIRIYNQLGQLLYRNEISSEQIISVVNFSEGSYFISLQTDETIEVKKFMVIH